MKKMSNIFTHIYKSFIINTTSANLFIIILYINSLYNKHCNSSEKKLC